MCLSVLRLDAPKQFARQRWSCAGGGAILHVVHNELHSRDVASHAFRSIVQPRHCRRCPRSHLSRSSFPSAHARAALHRFRAPAPTSINLTHLLFPPYTPFFHSPCLHGGLCLPRTSCRSSPGSNTACARVCPRVCVCAFVCLPVCVCPVFDPLRPFAACLPPPPCSCTRGASCGCPGRLSRRDRRKFIHPGVFILRRSW